MNYNNLSQRGGRGGSHKTTKSYRSRLVMVIVGKCMRCSDHVLNFVNIFMIERVNEANNT